MAEKSVPTKAPANTTTTVVRISASDDKTKKSKSSSKQIVAAKKPSKKAQTHANKKRGPLAAFFGYFKGAWQELKLVRWPTRRATWGLTIAVLLFSAFFVVFILLIDAGFKYLFEVIYKQ